MQAEVKPSVVTTFTTITPTSDGDMLANVNASVIDRLKAKGFSYIRTKTLSSHQTEEGLEVKTVHICR